MAEVTVSINGRSYNVACDDGQEERLMQLARYVDGNASDLASSVGQVGDARLMLMVSLMIADELFEARGRLKKLDDEVDSVRDARTAALERTLEAEGAVADILDRAAQRLDRMAQRIETA
ncbi:cell division protein ZapA [Tepidicaulis sp. LMO-SS28]|uniref:cell division protein ZapA n=1 Tax=Tepidicaulis sp. LMO-SS28 TaxID=3447455 RepID=UPI003EE1AD89